MGEIKVHGFLYYRVAPGSRTWEERKKVHEAVEAAQGFPGVVALYAYSLVGLRAATELGFWLATEDVQAYQKVGGRFLQTNMELISSLWGLVRPSQYTGQSGISVEVPGERKRYLVVYPFTKTHDWYQLSADDRRTIMKDHARVGHSFKEIEQVLVYSTGIADWEFVVGYETDDLQLFSELVMALRSTAVRPYTLSDTPIFTGRYGSLKDVLDEVYGNEDLQ
ncbi:MAG: chlorite dismutase family protein [Candidatus Methylomirabilales bacterium]